jgi:hypothetical protein
MSHVGPYLSQNNGTNCNHSIPNGRSIEEQRHRNAVGYDKNDLYEFKQSSCNVKSLLGDGKGRMSSFAVKVTIGLCHTHFTALTVKMH